MSGGPFLVGLIISTANVSLVLRHIKYRSELLTYGYSEENRPFKSETPFSDSKNYETVLSLTNSHFFSHFFYSIIY